MAVNIWDTQIRCVDYEIKETRYQAPIRRAPLVDQEHANGSWLELCQMRCASKYVRVSGRQKFLAPQ